MATLFDVTYDGGSDGAAVVDAGAGGEWDSIFGSGTAVHEADYAEASALGVKITGSRQMRKTVVSTNVWRERWFQQVPVANPGANTSVAEARAGSTIRAGVRIENGGTYRLVNGSTAVGSPSAAIVADARDRLEWAVNGPAGTQSLYLFKGANRHGTVPDETLTGTYTNATVDNIGVALFNNIAGYIVGQDSIRCTDTPATLIGGTATPATVAAPTVAAAATVLAPTVRLGVVAAAPRVAAVATVHALEGQSSATVSPDPVAGVATVPAPGVTAVHNATVLAPVVTAEADFPAAQLVIGTDATVVAPVVTAVATVRTPSQSGPPPTVPPAIDDLIFGWLGARTTGATVADRERTYYAGLTGLPASSTPVSTLKRTYYATQLGLSATAAVSRGLTALEIAFWESVDPANNTGSYQDRARRFYSS